ncbi:MAG: hypothetical protein IPM82_30415 [Saprospiraceae bacterium]|nr:hypothetical protein [Saprospiraceae bacterium]
MIIPDGYTAYGRDVSFYSGSTLELEGEANFEDLSLPCDLNIDAAAKLILSSGNVENLINYCRIEDKPGIAFIGLSISDYMDNYGDIEISDGGNGIHGLVIDGIAHNRSGGIISITDTGYGIYSNFPSAAFYNHAGASITMETSLTGISIGTSYEPIFENSGLITINGCSDDYCKGIQNRGNFTNKDGGVIIVTSGYTGIRNAGNFENEGNGVVSVLSSIAWGFENSVFNSSQPMLTNAGIITVSNANSGGTGGSFLLEDADFTNEATGQLNILDGNVTAYASDIASTTSNVGKIDIQGTYGTFGLSVEGSFNNTACGIVKLGSNDIYLPDNATITNAGWLELDRPSGYSIEEKSSTTASLATITLHCQAPM